MANNPDNHDREAVLEEAEVKPAVPTSSSSDDGNNSSGDSDEAAREDVAAKAPPKGGTAPSIVAYKDYSHVKPDLKENAALTTQNPTTKEPTFPVKLHMILSNPEFQDIVSWLPHGRSWRILQQKAFEERVIPLYFRHGRYSSFARQVNGWNFRRITGGSDFNSYYHELFLRGMQHLCTRMKRLTAKDIQERKQIDHNAPVPDFYALSRDHPLPESVPIPAQGLPMSLTPPAFASTAQSHQAVAAARAHATGIAEVELAILEKRRAEILQRIEMLGGPQAAPVPAMHSSQSGLNPQDLLSLQQQLNSANTSLNQNASVSALLTQLSGSGQGSDLAAFLSSLNQAGLKGHQQQAPAPPVPQPIATQAPVQQVSGHPQSTLLLQHLLLQQQQLMLQQQQASSVPGLNQASFQQLLQMLNGAAAPAHQAPPVSEHNLRVAVPSSNSDSDSNSGSGQRESNSTAVAATATQSARTPQNDVQQLSIANIAQLLGMGASNQQFMQAAPSMNLFGVNIAQLLGNSAQGNACPTMPQAAAPQTSATQTQFGGVDLSQVLGNAVSDDALATLQRQMLGSCSNRNGGK